MSRLQRLILPSLLLAFFCGLPASAISFTENFENWAWYSTPAGPAGYCQWGTPCFQVMGCGNGQNMFIRRINGLDPITQTRTCDYDHQVNHWTGGETIYHGNNSAVSGTKVAIHAVTQQTGHTAELMTSRLPHSSGDGSIQVDFYVHGAGIAAGNDEHYGVATHLKLNELPGCTRDCAAVPATATNTNEALSFYGAIFGSFGVELADKSQETHVGFAVEKACPVSGGGVIADSVIDWVDGTGKFPGNTWYRLRVQRFAPAFGEAFFAYQAYRRVNSSWVEIGYRTVPLSTMRCGQSLLDPGYLGLFGLIQSGSPSGVHIDWDNVVVSW
jgi:hypothetical protein